MRTLVCWMILCVSCVAAAHARPAVGEAGAFAEADAILIRGVVKSYLERIATPGGARPAIFLFHLPGDSQNYNGATSTATLDAARRECWDAVRQRLGAGAANELYPDLAQPIDVDGAEVTALDAGGGQQGAVLRTRGGLAFQLTKAGGKWLLCAPPRPDARTLIPSWTRGGRLALADANTDRKSVV